MVCGGGDMRVPTREEFSRIIDEAVVERNRAAKRAYEELPPLVQKFPDMARACGGANLILWIDGRTALGEFFKGLIANPLAKLSVWKKREGFQLHIGEPLKYQQEHVCREAETAVLKLIKRHLGIEGAVETYLS
jgi:hypothetical protein